MFPTLTKYNSISFISTLLGGMRETHNMLYSNKHWPIQKPSTHHWSLAMLFSLEDSQSRMALQRYLPVHYTTEPGSKAAGLWPQKQKQTALTLDCSSFIYPKISWWWLKKIICLTYHCCCCCCLWSLIPITPLDHSPTDDMWRNRPLD